MSRARVSRAAAILAAACWWQPAGAAGDAARGQVLAQQGKCGVCHGAQGVSALPKIPSLAGHPTDFTTLQLILMREGIRVALPMNELAKGMPDDQIEDLAAYYASLPPAPPEDRGPADPALMQAGARLAEQHRCGVCHLPDYRGRAQIPHIAGQREEYLLYALKGYRDGTRQGADTNMNEAVHGVNDAELAALAHFMAQQR